MKKRPSCGVSFSLWLARIRTGRSELGHGAKPCPQRTSEVCLEWQTEATLCNEASGQRARRKSYHPSQIIWFLQTYHSEPGSQSSGKKNFKESPKGRFFVIFIVAFMKKRAKKQSKKTAPRKRYSPYQQQIIHDLAALLGKLIPATSQGSFSLQKISKKKGLGKFFDEKLSSKQKQFAYFISEVHRRHPRMLKPFINDILAEAVIKRRTKGDPLLRPEADLLKQKLFEFGIDLRKEIDELDLPTTRPAITPPPATVLQSLERIGLHPLLLESVLSLFKDGYMNEAVRKSGEVFETAISRWSGVRGRYGRDLMSHVFNKDSPIIDISTYHGSEISNPMDEKEGFMLVAMGAMQWCKNTVGHGDVNQLPPHEAASRIILMNHLIEVVDSMMKKQEETKLPTTQTVNKD